MSSIVEGLLGLSGLAAYTVVGVLAFGEAAAFVGLFLPGEMAVLLGGVVASSGRASLPVMIVVAVVAAIVGDSVGYEIGRHFGPRLLERPWFADRFGERLERTAAYLRATGGRAVFLGRWTSLLRALIPGVAGMSRMPYRQFLTFNIIGGIAWGTTFVLAGYAAGSSWRTVERIAGQASLLLLAVLAVLLIVRSITRRLLRRVPNVQAWFEQFAGRALPSRLLDRIDGPLVWVRMRLAPGAVRGLGWTFCLVLGGLSSWVVGFAVQDLFVREELALIDGPVARWIAVHATAQAAAVAEVVTDVLGPPWGVWLVVVIAVITHRFEGVAAARRVIIAPVLATALAWTLQALLPSTTAGTTFPALSTTAATALVVVATPVAARRDWALSIRLAGVGTAVVTIVAVAELVSGEASLSGIVGGAALGMLLGVGGELTGRLVGDVADGRPRERGPAAVGADVVRGRSTTGSV